MAAVLCEEARDTVLAESISKTSVDEALPKLIRGLWLADIGVKGPNELRSALSELPKATLARLIVANHLMQRVYWKQWKKETKLALLNVADECLRNVGIQYDKRPVINFIKSEGDNNDGDRDSV